jgi:rod shape-determining protein MreC
MVKSLGQTDAARRLMIGCVGVLALLSLLPLSVTGWVSHLSALPRALVAPASSQLTKLATWMGGPTLHRPDMPSAEDVQRTLLEQQTMIAQLRSENARLERSLKELAAIVKVDASAAGVRSLVAPVIGTFSSSAGSVIRVKAGSSDGVTKNTVAVGPLLQVVGLVTEVEARTCTVQLLTAKETKLFHAAIMITDVDSLPCFLAPTAGGLLKGDVEWISDTATRERLLPQAGQYVRLKAGGPWPSTADMFIVGTVESVGQGIKAPGRKSVVVRPTIDPLSKVGEVILRLEPAREGTP